MKAVPCPCGDSICKDWHVTGVANVQGVRFTQEQAEAVAALLSEERDPLDPTELMPGEKRFALMGRDGYLAPGVIRLYADLREGKFERADMVYAALKAKARTRPPSPKKDAKHAWNARAIAGDMEAWFASTMTGEEPVNRVNLMLEGEEVTSHPNDIKRARPPAEPDEAS